MNTPHVGIGPVICAPWFPPFTTLAFMVGGVLVIKGGWRVLRCVYARARSKSAAYAHPSSSLLPFVTLLFGLMAGLIELKVQFDDIRLKGEAPVSFIAGIVSAAVLPVILCTAASLFQISMLILERAILRASVREDSNRGGVDESQQA